MDLTRIYVRLVVDLGDLEGRESRDRGLAGERHCGRGSPREGKRRASGGHCEKCYTGKDHNAQASRADADQLKKGRVSMLTFESSSQCACAAGRGFELLSRASDQRWDEVWWRRQPAVGGEIAASPARCRFDNKSHGNRRLQAFCYRDFARLPKFFGYRTLRLVFFDGIGCSRCIPLSGSPGPGPERERRVSEIVCCGVLGSEFFVLSEHKRL